METGDQASVSCVGFALVIDFESNGGCRAISDLAFCLAIFSRACNRGLRMQGRRHSKSSFRPPP